MFVAKDFIETAEGLMFAVVENGEEQGRVLCFLRYVKSADGWRKYSTDRANALLTSKFHHYLFYSLLKDVQLHGVPVDAIIRHHQPKQRLNNLLQGCASDQVEQDLISLVQLYRQNGLDLQRFGVTGSILIGAQNQHSDIDLVVYDRQVFHQARMITRQLMENSVLQELDEADWLESFQRRSCELDFAEYVWHERRKFNKAVINGRKFDLNLLAGADHTQHRRYRKFGAISLQAVIADDSQAYDYPAVFSVNHEQAAAIVSYTATYTGQALSGEKVEVSGQLERSELGEFRVVIGSSREAQGEYIKVINAG